MLQALVLTMGCSEIQLSPHPGGSAAPGDTDIIEHIGNQMGIPSEGLLRGPAGELTTPPEPPNTPDGRALYAEGVIHDIHIELGAEELASLRAEPRTPVRAWIEVGGEAFPNVELRLKGVSSYRNVDKKPSFKIDLHEWELEQRVDGEKRLTLNNMIQDPTMLREHAYYWLARELGVPAPRYAYARVRVNDLDYGLYGLVETMDEEIVEQLFDNDEDGNLYESSGADFTYARDWFDLEETAGIVATPDDIEALVDAVEAASDEEYWAMLQANFDIDAVLSYWAVDIVAGNDDGYVYNRHNYLAYYAPLAQRWSLLPWGTDRSFSRDVPPTGDDRTPLVGELVIRCWDDAACADALTRRIVDVLAVWESTFPVEVTRAADQIEADCESDPRKEYDCDPDHLTDFIDERAAFVRARL
ncbi:MAG: CotH kinase family protein [Pseudomonadota bacterium]|nr:CotH kinase family protein [Pseudomonadota bacterium]